MPYRKRNTKIVYVNKKSNHLANVLNHISVALNKCFQKIFSNSKKQPDHSSKLYEHVNVNFSQKCEKNKKKKEEKHIIF